MERRTGIWVDHDHALIVTLTSFGQTIERLRSEVGKRVRLSEGSRSRTVFGPQDVSDELSRDARHQQKLQRYYDRIVAMVQKSDAIFVCGPGEARLELVKTLQQSAEMAPRIREGHPADKMTDRQFVAHVRKHYEQARPRRRTSQA